MYEAPGYQAVTFVCAAVAGTGIWPTQGAQIVHHSVFPYERVLRCAKEGEGVGDRIDSGGSDYLSPVIDIHRKALPPAQGSKIDDLTVLPQNGMARRGPEQRIDFTILRDPRNPPACINRVGPAGV